MNNTVNDDLDVSIHKFMETFLKLRRQTMGLTLDQQRKQFKEWSLAQRNNLPEVKDIKDLRIDGSHGSIPLRIYLPNTPPPFPVIIFFHHGGWVYGSNEEAEPICRKLVNASQSAVVSVDYPLSPENRFPKAIDEAYNTVKWLASHAGEFGGDPKKLYVCGESAGGNIATVTALLARDNGGPPLKGQILICPILNHNFDEKEYANSQDKYLITLENMQWFWQQYLENPEDGNNPYASPLKAESLKNLPPTLILTAEHDTLTLDAEKYASRLKEDGVPTEIHTYPGTIHGFIDLPICHKQETQALNDIQQWLR